MRAYPSWEGAVSRGHKTEVGVGEIADIRKDGRHIGFGDAEPSRQCAGVLFNAGRRDPAAAGAGAGVGVVGAAKGKVREITAAAVRAGAPVDVATMDRAA